MVPLAGAGVLKEKSQEPTTPSGSVFVEPAAGSVTFTESVEAHSESSAGTLAVSVVAFTNVVASATPPSLIADCAVNPLPVAVIDTGPEPAVVLTGVISINANAGRFGS